MENELRKVRVLQNDGFSQLIQIEDEFGERWVKRCRVHRVGKHYVLSSERQAEVARRALARREKREALRLAKEKLASESKNEIAA